MQKSTLEKANLEFYFFKSLPPEHEKTNICEREIFVYRDTVWNFTQKFLSINIKSRKLLLSYSPTITFQSTLIPS